MKLILVAISALLLTGCASAAKYESALNTWVGTDHTLLVSQWGPPSSTYEVGDGTRILTWSRSGMATSQSTYNQFTGQFFTTTNVPWCNTSFQVMPDGKVGTWRYEGNACRSN